MSDIKTLSKKLRHAADVLDDLLETAGTPAIAKKIVQNMDKTVIPAKRTYAKRKKAHWTQTVAGRKKMAAVQREAWVARKAQVKLKKHA